MVSYAKLKSVKRSMSKAVTKFRLGECACVVMHGVFSSGRNDHGMQICHTNSLKIKALKALVWHLSMELM